MGPTLEKTFWLFLPLVFITTYAFFITALIIIFIFTKHKGKYIRMANDDEQRSKIGDLHHIVKFVLILGLLAFPAFLITCAIYTNGTDAVNSLTPEAAMTLRYFFLFLTVLTFLVALFCLLTWPKKIASTYACGWKEQCRPLSRQERARLATELHFRVLDAYWA